MKKIIFSVLLGLLAITAFGQSYSVTLHSSFFDKDYKVESGDENVAIDVVCKDSKNGNIMYKTAEAQKFYNAMVELKAKFDEWEKTAKENNVKTLDKEIPNSLPRVTIAWYGSKWWFAFLHRLNPRFRILDDGRMLVVMTGTVKASSNQYIDETYYFALDGEELGEFIKAIDPETIKNADNKQKEVEDLFK